jgi:hypothetical protein
MLHYAHCSIAIFDSWDVHCKANLHTLEPGDSDKISVDPRDLCRQAADGSRWQQSLFFICLLNSTSSVVFLLTQRSGGLGPLQLEPCAWLGASFGTLVSFDLVYGHEYHSIRYALFGYRVGQQNIAM